MPKLHDSYVNMVHEVNASDEPTRWNFIPYRTNQSNKNEVGSRLLGGDTVYIYHTEVEALLSNGTFCATFV